MVDGDTRLMAYPAIPAAVLLIVFNCVIAASAVAAARVETRVGDTTVSLIADPESGLVALSSDIGIKLVDTVNGLIYLLDQGQPARVVDLKKLPEPRIGGHVVVQKIGPGPRIAGFPTSRFRIWFDGQLCTTVDANLWLNRSLDPAPRAFELLDRLNMALSPGAGAPCERIPYRHYKWIGWGMRVADVNGQVVEATLVEAHAAIPVGALRLPLEPTDVTDAILAAGTR